MLIKILDDADFTGVSDKMRKKNRLYIGEIHEPLKGKSLAEEILERFSFLDPAGGR